MQDRYFVAENLVQVGGNGGSQANLGDEQNGGAACIQHGAHYGEINRRFSRAGDAVQQHA